MTNAATIRFARCLIAILMACVPVGFSPAVVEQSENEGETATVHVVKVGASAASGAARRLPSQHRSLANSTFAHISVGSVRHTPLPQLPDPVAHIIRC